MVSLTLKEIGDTIQIKMFSPNKKEWAIALTKVKRLDGARFDGDSKCWVCTNSEANKCTLLTVGRTSGIKKTQDSVMSRCPSKYLDFVSAEEFIPNFDVKERQKRLIDGEELNGPLVKGLRNYQIDFLKFMVVRNGKAILGDEMGCVSGDAEVTVNRHKASKTMSLEKLYSEFHRKSSRKVYTNEERPWFIRCLHEDGVFRLGEVVDVIQSGIKHCVKVTLEGGYELKLTPDHLMKTEDGWVEAKDSLGRGIVCNGTESCKICGCTENLITYPRSKFLGLCRSCMYKERSGPKWKDKELHEVIHSDGYVYLEGYPVRGYKGCRRTDGVPKHRYVMEQYLGRYLKSSEVVHHLDENKLNNDISNLVLCNDHSAHSAFHKGEFYKKFKFVNPSVHKVTSVEDVGDVMTYDVKVLNHGNFLANKVVVHNCGKTISSLSWLAYSDSFPALIVVTAPTKLQWEREYNRWLEDFPNSQPVQVLRGQTPTRIYAGTTVIINWDILHYWEKELKRCKFRCIIGDEAQAIGNPDSKRAKAFIKLSESIPSCIVMSGTPARSRPAQYWSMIHCVEPTLFPDYKAYLWRYCDPKFTPFSIQPTFNGAKNTTELHYRLMKCMLRRTKEEVMTELPSKQVEVVPLEVDESFKDEYSIAEDELKTSTNSELRMKVAALGRCAYLMKEKSLIKWTEELLDSSGEKVVIFCWHRDVVDLLMEGFAKYNPTKIYGGMSLRDREDSKAKFISDESCRVIVGNIQALGTGVDGLQKVCCKAIFAEFANTITDSLQAEDRLHRGGQDKQVTIYYTCAKDTIDETLMKALDDKRKVLDSVLNGKETDDSDLLGAILKRYNNK